jgi:hypothetical protein
MQITPLSALGIFGYFRHRLDIPQKILLHHCASSQRNTCIRCPISGHLHHIDIHRHASMKERRTARTPTACMHINIANLKYDACLFTVWDHVSLVLLTCVSSDSIFAQPFQTAITGMCSTTQPGHICVSLDMSRTRSTSARCRGNGALISCSQTSWRSSQTDESSVGACAAAGSPRIKAKGENSHGESECQGYVSKEAGTSKRGRRAGTIASPASASVTHRSASNKEDSASSSTALSPAGAHQAVQEDGIDKDVTARQQEDIVAPICCLVHVDNKGECVTISRYVPIFYVLSHMS